MQKHVNLVDLVKSFLTSIYLEKSASIQPRTSLSKFGGKFISLFIRLLTHAGVVPQPEDEGDDLPAAHQVSCQEGRERADGEDRKKDLRWGGSVKIESHGLIIK